MLYVVVLYWYWLNQSLVHVRMSGFQKFDVRETAWCIQIVEDYMYRGSYVYLSLIFSFEISTDKIIILNTEHEFERCLLFFRIEEN